MRTRKVTVNDEPEKVRCKRCGFMCDTSRDRTDGNGDGITYVPITHSADTAPHDPTVKKGQGCPFCGTYNYLTWKR